MPEKKAAESWIRSRPIVKKMAELEQDPQARFDLLAEVEEKNASLDDIYVLFLKTYVEMEKQ